MRVNYNGIVLVREEIDALKELESLIHEKIIPIRQEYMNQLIQNDLSVTQKEDIKPVATLIAENNHIITLKLSSCDLNVFPDSIGEFRNLKTLILNGNNLYTVKKSILNLVQLNYLDLSFNDLHDLSADFGALQSLSYLKLNNNKMKFIRNNLIELTNLKELNLLENPISIPPDWLQLLEVRGCHVIKPRTLILKERYQFIRNDVFLCAWVHSITNKQKLIMQKIDPNTGKVEFDDEIQCIHTAVCTLPACDLEDAIDEDQFEENMLNIRSSEKLVEINLEPEEKFKALKSWVAGIAEAGEDAFRIQVEIDKATNILYPIANRLLQFMMRVDHHYIFEYLARIERESVYQGVKHEAYMIANLTLVLNILNPKNSPKDVKILRAVFNLDPPLKLFTENPNFIKYLSLPEAASLSNYDLGFSHYNPLVRLAIAKNPNSTEFEEFNNFISPTTEKDFSVRYAALGNLSEARSEQYNNLFYASGLFKEESEAMKELENYLRIKIPNLKSIEGDHYNTPDIFRNDVNYQFGFVVKEDHISELSLADCGLIALPKYLRKLKYLEALYVPQNWLKFLPDWIGEFTYLQKLILRNNTLTSLPDSICDLISLKYLDVKNNKLTGLPESFGRLINLDEFHSEGNNFEMFPEYIKNIDRIKKLRLKTDRILALPSHVEDNDENTRENQ